MDFFVFALAGLVVVASSDVIGRYLKDRAHSQRILAVEEQRTRRIEAVARMDEPTRDRLLETMPDWLDQGDPDDVDAWKKARAETLKHGASS